MDQTELFISKVFTPPHGFTEGIEGPACDADGNLYAVNFARQGTIGRVRPDGTAEVFVELPGGSTGNGIRFNQAGEMLVADYTGHNILKFEMESRWVSVYAHEPTLHQPNDIAITASGIVFASDPNWAASSGRVWRVGIDRQFVLMEEDMGTTNGIEVSPDEQTLYVNESVQRRIWAYDLNTDGDVSNKRLLIEFPDFGLDGMRCDQTGDLFVTRFGKGVVAQISQDGVVRREISLHGKNCTNLAFGGPDGRTCYVTVADQGNVEWFRAEVPGREAGLIHR